MVCARCPRHDNPADADLPGIAVRHLLYHVYPRRGSRWRERVLRLRERIEHFNGRRVVAVASDGTTDPPAHVADALAGCGCEVVPVENDPNLREVATFLPLFERVSELRDPTHATLYAHAKAVTRPEGAACHEWAAALEEVLLNWPAVAEGLRRHPLAGAFKKVGRGWPESSSDWHFSGSWFWFRNAELFAKDWRRIDRFWSGIEPYPSLHFPKGHAACVFHAGTVDGVRLYDGGYWERAVRPELEKFRAKWGKPSAESVPRRSLLPPSAWAHVFGPLCGKRVGYVATPGNAGDHLIEAATFQLLAHFGVRWTHGPDPTADVLLVAGGGSMGAGCYGLCRDARRRALSAGPPVWVLPSSWWGPDEDTPRFAKAFARDAESLAHAGPGAEFAPDLALGLEAGPFAEPTAGRGVYLRQDVEGLFNDRTSEGDPVRLASGEGAPGWAYLALAARHAEIVTDRLHFAVAGLLAGRRVTLVPNSYHKNRAAWEASLAALGCGWADSPEDVP
jgi:hypothetical protein